MKAYIGNIDWADEGYVFFFSVKSEDKLQDMSAIIEMFLEYNIMDNEQDIEMYWGTNECFCFVAEDLLEFINQARDISEEKLSIFKRFNVEGFDIYEQISEELRNILFDDFREVYTEEMTQADQVYIEHLVTNLFGKEIWARIMN